VSPRTANRLKLLGIGLAALLPVVASYLLYLYWVPERHVNYGELLQPAPVPAAALPLVEGSTFRFSDLRGHWVLVAIGSGTCPPACEQRLWAMRQVRLAQGKHAPRVERVWLIDDANLPQPRVRDAYAGTWMVQADGNSLLNAFPAGGSNRDHLYLVDPLGNLIMRYPAALDPKAMIKDLGRLLKYSRAG
jgi:cytochrome oxidase Cu insertion factor (SCO1/SenC/PrrC family)